MTRRSPGVVDPLADLRQDDTATGITTAPPEPDPADDEPQAAIVDGVLALDALWHQDAASRIVARWHADSTARTQMHGGGTCGCRYLAAQALLEAVGLPVEAEPETEPEP